MFDLNLEPWRVLCMNVGALCTVNGREFKLGMHAKDTGIPDKVYLYAHRGAEYIPEEDEELYSWDHVRSPNYVALMTRVELYKLLESGEFSIS